MTEQLQDEVPSIEVEDKPEVLDLDVIKEEAINEDDPRAAIYAKHRDKRQAEISGTPVGSEPQTDAAPAAVVEEEVEEEVTVKINGREKKVSRAKVDEAGGVDAYQKRAAAAEELRLAKEERHKLQDMEAQLTEKARQLQAYEQQISQRAVQQPAASPPPNEGEMKQLAGKYHEAILNGDIDVANDLLIKLQGAQKVATPDGEAIARRAVAEAKSAMDAERRAERQQAFELERQEAVARFESEFTDIADDPELRDFADMKTIKIMQAHPDWRPGKVIDEAARQVREALGKPVKAEPSEKLEAKRSMTTVRGGSSRATPRPVPKPQTSSQYVEGLRKARGLE